MKISPPLKKLSCMGLMAIGLFLAGICLFPAQLDAKGVPGAPSNQGENRNGSKGCGSGCGAETGSIGNANQVVQILQLNTIINTLKLGFTVTAMALLLGDQSRLPQRKMDKGERQRARAKDATGRARRATLGGTDGNRSEASLQTFKKHMRSLSNLKGDAQAALKPVILAVGYGKEAEEDSVRQFRDWCEGSAAQSANLPCQERADLNWYRGIYQYVRLCASDMRCTAAGICDLCDGGYRRREREKILGYKDPTPYGYVPTAFFNYVPGSLPPAAVQQARLAAKEGGETGLIKVGLVLTAAGGSGGGCQKDIKGAALNPSEIDSWRNNQIGAGQCGWEATITQGIVDGGVPLPVGSGAGRPQTYNNDHVAFNPGSMDDQKDYERSITQLVALRTAKFKTTPSGEIILVEGGGSSSSSSKVAGDFANLARVNVATKAIGAAGNRGNLSGNNCNATDNQAMEAARARDKYPPSDGQCQSCPEAGESMNSLENVKDDSDNADAGNAPATTKRNGSAGGARSAYGRVCPDGVSGEGAGGSRRGAGPSIMAEYGLFNDKFFLALLKSKTFHHMVAMTIPRMPQIYAAENRTIMAAIARSHGQPETYYAGRDAPEEPMENPEVVPPKPFEKSASLSAIFASSGVNISGWTSMPVVMPVKMDGLGEMPPGAMKAILISDPPAH